MKDVEKRKRLQGLVFGCRQNVETEFTQNTKKRFFVPFLHVPHRLVRLQLTCGHALCQTTERHLFIRSSFEFVTVHLARAPWHFQVSLSSYIHAFKSINPSRSCGMFGRTAGEADKSVPSALRTGSTSRTACRKFHKKIVFFNDATGAAQCVVCFIDDDANMEQ